MATSGAGCVYTDITVRVDTPHDGLRRSCCRQSRRSHSEPGRHINRDASSAWDRCGGAAAVRAMRSATARQSPAEECRVPLTASQALRRSIATARVLPERSVETTSRLEAGITTSEIEPSRSGGRSQLFHWRSLALHEDAGTGTRRRRFRTSSSGDSVTATHRGAATGLPHR